MTLGSDNVSGYSRAFPGKGASNNSGVIEKCFSGFRTLQIRHLRKWGQYYYIVLFSPLSPFHWQQNTWPWMATLHTQFSIFTIMNSVSARRLHIYRRATYRTFLLYDVTSTDLRKRTVKTVIRSILRSRERIADLSILSSTKSCGRYVVWTSTNKADVIAFTLSLIAFPLIPKHVTLNDLEWPFCVKLCFAPVCLEVWSLAFYTLATLKHAVNVVGEL